jgi:putative pyruvate formate lyase activating enzyme
MTAIQPMKSERTEAQPATETADIAGIAKSPQSPRPDHAPPPGYLRLLETGELAERARLLDAMQSPCALCPRRCGVDRKSGRTGVCGADHRPKIAAASIHMWEEPPITGMRGSGTIFFSGCTLQCIFCQNYPISQLGTGRILTPEELARQMLRLQKRGAHNINLVTPTHQAPAFVQALLVAASEGLRIPIVYNTSGYETVEALRLLEGIVDVYLPDIKYDSPEAARLCSRRPDYVSHNRAALLEMWRQVGPIRTDAEGLAYRGMLVRHMVLPDNLAGSEKCFEFLAREIGPDVWVSLMNQYFPAYKALQVPPLDRKATSDEYESAFEALERLGLHNGFVQECDGAPEGE